MKMHTAALLFSALGLAACGDTAETPYKSPPGGGAAAEPPGGEQADPAAAEAEAPERGAPPAEEAADDEAADDADDKAAEGEETDSVENWVVWPGEHASWISFDGGVTTITRDAVDTKAKTLVCNKPGASIDGDSAHIQGRWRHDITDGVGRITVRYFVGDQPLKQDGKRVYTDLSIGRDAADDWIEIDQWVEIPEGADNLRYCTELKGRDGVVTTDDLRISEWK